MENKLYKLIGKDGKTYLSEKPGQLGGNKDIKIYGKLDCPSALRWIAKGKYVKNRVFFANEADAIKAGYRPCAVCMKEKYKQWKEKQNSQEK
ncbi:MAG: Ada metal-binding domain-containing protein [Clostridia bacterium]|nr:Ada metal-binding domain-containing protein [Clostridia bacterium]